MSACEALGLKPASIVFEVTETDRVTNVQYLRQVDVDYVQGFYFARPAEHLLASVEIGMSSAA